MKTNYRNVGTCAVAIFLAAQHNSQAATLINTYGPSNITVTASSFINGNTAPSKTVDASGLNTGTGTHSNGTQTSWMTTANNNDVSDEWIQWDLGSTYVLDSIQVWNYNDFSRFDSGLNQFDIYVASSLSDPSSDPEAGAFTADWTLIGNNVTLSKASSLATYTGVDLETDTGISLPGSAIRYVRFEVDSTHWDGAGPGNLLGEHQVGIAEIQFSEAVPEPSSTVFLGLGSLLLMFRRRK